MPALSVVVSGYVKKASIACRTRVETDFPWGIVICYEQVCFRC